MLWYRINPNSTGKSLTFIILIRPQQLATSPHPLISVQTQQPSSFSWILLRYPTHAYVFESLYFLEVFPPPHRCHVFRPFPPSWLFKIMMFGEKYKSCRSSLRNFYTASRFSALITNIFLSLEFASMDNVLINYRM